MRKAEERKIIETFIMVYCDICARAIGEEASSYAESSGYINISIKDVSRNEWTLNNNRHFHVGCLEGVCKLKPNTFEPKIV